MAGRKRREKGKKVQVKLFYRKEKDMIEKRSKEAKKREKKKKRTLWDTHKALSSYFSKPCPLHVR